MTASSAADVSRQIPAVVRAPPSWNNVIPFHNIPSCTHLCIDRLEIQSMPSGRHKRKLCMLLTSRIPDLSPPRPPHCATWTEATALNESLWVALKLHFPNVWHFNTRTNLFIFLTVKWSQIIRNSQITEILSLRGPMVGKKSIRTPLIPR